MDARIKRRGAGHGAAAGPILAAALLCAVPAVRAQDLLQSAANQAQVELDEALKDLAKARETIAAERVPLAHKLAGLEDQLVAARRAFDDASRSRDTRTLDAVNLRSDIKTRSQEAALVADLLDEYVRGFESRVHIAELQRYRPAIEAARAAADRSDATTLAKLTGQMKVIEASLERIGRIAGGDVFGGAAVAPGGEVSKGTFALVGPVAVFASEDGRTTGVVEQRLGSSEPNVADIAGGAFAKPIRELVARGEGRMPMHPTMGGAVRQAGNRETLMEHIAGGGPTMVPILALGACALAAALVKLIQVRGLREVGERDLEAIFREVNARGIAAGLEQARRIGGHGGGMLEAALGHIGESKDLIEEVMFEKVLAAKAELERLLPLIALCASAAPLFGLLGTVTGMIETFKTVAVFGTDDARALSGGISEAMVATEYGLIVAIPSLLMHAFLSRKIAGVLRNMERVAVAFMTRLPAATEKRAA